MVFQEATESEDGVATHYHVGKRGNPGEELLQNTDTPPGFSMSLKNDAAHMYFLKCYNF